jgi:2-dehydro-3-deoxygalactonokinase
MPSPQGGGAPAFESHAEGEEDALLKTMAWIAVDWGTSNLRVWGIGADGGVVAEASSDKGMGKLDCSGFEPALLDLVGGWLSGDQQTLVIACGMVGARQGWIEVPYRQAPCLPVFSDVIGTPETSDPRLKVRVLAGVKQIKPDPDVMRGEETQIAGFLSENRGFEGTLCLPGTHTKWVRIEAGEILHFKTFMTGELYNLLATQSVLRHSLNAAGWDKAEFASTVKAGASQANRFAERLFSIRAESLICGLEPATAKARLSAILIGAELAAAQDYWMDRNLIIVGNGAQSETYAEGLLALGRSPRLSDATHVTLAGLKSAYQHIARDF